MKKLILLLAIVATLSSCEKNITNIYEADKGNFTEMIPTKDEITNVSDKQILENEWTHVKEFASVSNNLYMWKYKSGNMVIILNAVPTDMFYNPIFAVGTKLTGEEMLELVKVAKKGLPVYLK